MRLARAAGARFIAGEATGLDPAAREIRLRGDRPALRYDLLSLNVGAAPRPLPGAAEHALALRPFGRFLEGWHALVRRVAASRRPLRLLVAGGGAAGVEVALALRRRFGEGVTLGLICRSGRPLPRQPDAACAIALRALARAGVAVHAGEAAAVTPEALICADGGVLPCDTLISATGAAPPGWFAASGLLLCPRGFVAVGPSLRSVSDAHVFAAGDCATVLAHERERSGVFAVRQGAPLAANLRRALAGRPPRPFRPQRTALALLATGAERAIALRGAIAVEHGWALRLKDRIDRRWIAMHDAMRPMARPVVGVPQEMRCGGCAAKLPPVVLSRVLARLPRRDGASAVALGLGQPDDAALLRPPPPGRLLAQSVDMFRAMVDDPWLFGRIAATHALGDIAAMGATPQAALAIATLPPAAEALLEADLLAMLSGAEAVLHAAGALLVGGHSAEGAEPMLGFSIAGEVEEKRVLRRSGLRGGDLLVLTKPLGTGVLLAGAMRGGIGSGHLARALEAMQQSPFPAAALLRAHGATACTDVTGFGLINHLGEMLHASGVGALVEPLAVPTLQGAPEALAAGMASTLHPANAAAARARLGERWGAVPPYRLALLLDPQTAGGLLAGLPPAAAAPCVAALREVGCEAAVIGRIVDEPAGLIGAVVP
jgi:selenide,water dikinase